MRTLSWFFYRRMDATHVITKKMQNILLSLGIENTTLIYNGHNLELYKRLAKEPLPIDISDDKYVYLNVGRLNSQKGQWHLLKAFSICARNNSNAILIIIGEGGLRKDLESLIESLNIKDKVLILKNTLNIFPYIQRANCFCFTSLYEGLPNVLIEAISIGKPIVTTDCISGPREIVFPELDIEEKIEYPYRSSSGILTAPFPFSDIDISTKIYPLEEEYAIAMERIAKDSSHDFNQSNKSTIFSEDVIIEKWKKLIET